MVRRRHVISLYSFLGLLVALPSWAVEVKDCSITHTDIKLVNYKDTASTLKNERGQSRMAVAVDHIQPRLANGTVVDSGQGGKIVFVCAGMSNADQACPKWVQAMKELTGARNTKGRLIVPPELVFVNVSVGGDADREWADPNHPAWARARERVEATGASMLQVQVWLHTHAVKLPTVLGSLTAQLVTKVLANAEALAPNIALHLMYDLGYTGYSRNLDDNGNPIGDGYPVKHPRFSEVAKDGHVLAGIASTQSGVPAGTVAEYFRIATDGDWYDDEGASSSYPNGLYFRCPLLREDGIHYTTSGGADSGAKAVGTNMAERLVEHPILRTMFPWLP